MSRVSRWMGHQDEFRAGRSYERHQMWIKGCIQRSRRHDQTDLWLYLGVWIIIQFTVCARTLAPYHDRSCAGVKVHISMYSRRACFVHDDTASWIGDIFVMMAWAYALLLPILITIYFLGTTLVLSCIYINPRIKKAGNSSKNTVSAKQMSILEWRHGDNIKSIKQEESMVVCAVFSSR